MRRLLLALALVFAPQALAQQNPNLAGFRIGMSVDEARALAPDRIPPLPSGPGTRRSSNSAATPSCSICCSCAVRSNA